MMNHLTRLGILLLTVLLPSCCIGPGAPGNSGASRAPSFDYAEAGGCSHIQVYKRNLERTEVLIVRADKDKLGLDKASKSFALETTGDGLTVAVDLYSRTPQHFAYCTDIYDANAEKPVTWKATKGTAIISVEMLAVGAPDARPSYEAKVTLQDVVFEDSRGRQAKLKGPLTIVAVVGWIP